MKRLSGLFSTPKITFQILSDLYLNYEQQYLTFHIPVSAPYLILAGNVGQLADYDAYLSFLVRRCNLYEKVFLILGALEFHGLTHAEGLQLAHHMEEEVATRGRLQILHRTRADVPHTNVTLLGCTLWSNIPESAEAAVVKKAPEFDTMEGIRQWSVDNHNEEHFRDLAWLQGEINGPRTFAGAESSSAPTSQVIVVSSFTPDLHHTLAPWQVHSPWCAAYGTDLLNGTDWNIVKYWVHGTTGRTGKAKRFGLKIVSNQRGRVGEEEKGILEDNVPKKDKIDLFDVTKVIQV
ncbi:ser/Thr protein phosphatase superfamily [Paraphaeosphaeria sporulosa]|uniref:Ser/Thr protein phosphatase superfamily n=1 Tax=Paraphaeosphaeria sporulosa TaxID=1460663 RepID=A0A177C3N4_9PLEO|nr:ser/Thr protein phosphatase superfamily [Paraphaeosphaeria sporulosa]OAG01398.1 ser/Thr protein phosphatase superfamily [Paraphaeosphaeria sporulosa]